MARKKRGSVPVHTRDPRADRTIVIPAPRPRGGQDPVVNRHAPVFGDRTRYDRKRNHKPKEDE